MEYIVKLRFVYSDTVVVDAESKEEAESKALDACNEQYEYFMDSCVEISGLVCNEELK